MSHYFELSEIKQKLITVSALALSGEEFSKRYYMGVNDIQKVYTLSEYTKLTKLIVSNSLIEVSVKMRCLVDDLKQKNILIEDGDKIKIYNSGRCADGNFKEKGFRFICNKIIHAESFNLDYIGKTTYHADMVWWSGEITLSGKYDGKNWEFFFSVIHWLDQVMNFINRTEKEITRLQGDSRDLQNHS